MTPQTLTQCGPWHFSRTGFMTTRRIGKLNMLDDGRVLSIRLDDVLATHLAVIRIE
mgnify:CR=1 FL=1